MASAAASSQEEELVPITSITRYTLMTTSHRCRWILIALVESSTKGGRFFLDLSTVFWQFARVNTESRLA
jgi:hypothetical protein